MQLNAWRALPATVILVLILDDGSWTVFDQRVAVTFADLTARY